jgi:hypothetical protein
VTLYFISQDLQQHNVYFFEGPPRLLCTSSSLSTFGEARYCAASGHKGGTEHTI